MPEEGQYDRNMQHVLTILIKFIAVDAARMSNCNTIYQNGMNCTKKQPTQCTTYSQIHLQLPHIRQKY
jgi:hypothetical protein